MRVIVRNVKVQPRMVGFNLRQLLLYGGNDWGRPGSWILNNRKLNGIVVKPLDIVTYTVDVIVSTALLTCAVDNGGDILNVHHLPVLRPERIVGYGIRILRKVRHAYDAFIWSTGDNSGGFRHRVFIDRIPDIQNRIAISG